MFTQPKQDINIWDLELCILHPGTQRVWGAKFELDITELNSKLRHMQKGSSYRLRLLTCGGRPFPQLADIRRKLFTHLYQLFFTMQILLSHSAWNISMDIELNEAAVLCSSGSLSCSVVADGVKTGHADPPLVSTLRPSKSRPRAICFR